MKDEIPEWTMPEEFIEKQMEIEEETGTGENRTTAGTEQTLGFHS